MFHGLERIKKKEITEEFQRKNIKKKQFQILAQHLARKQKRKLGMFFPKNWQKKQILRNDKRKSRMKINFI